MAHPAAFHKNLTENLFCKSVNPLEHPDWDAALARRPDFSFLRGASRIKALTTALIGNLRFLIFVLVGHEDSGFAHAGRRATSGFCRHYWPAKAGILGISGVCFPAGRRIASQKLAVVLQAKLV